MAVLDYVFPLLILQAFIWLYYLKYTNEGTVLALLLLMASILSMSLIVTEHLTYVITNDDKINDQNKAIRLLNKCLESPLTLSS